MQISDLEGNIRNNFNKKIRADAKLVYPDSVVPNDFQKRIEWGTLLKKLGIEEKPAATAWTVIVVLFPLLPA